MDFLYSCNYPKLVNKVTVFLFCFAKQKKEVIFNHLFLFF